MGFGFNNSFQLLEGDYGESYRYDMTSFLEKLSELESFSFGAGTQYWRLTGNASNFTESGGFVSCRISCSLSLTGPYFPYDPVTYDWDYTVSYSRHSLAESCAISPMFGIWLWVGNSDLFRITTHFAFCSRDYETASAYDLVSGWTAYACFRPGSSLATPAELDGLQDTLSSKLSDFAFEISSQWRDLIPSSLFSSVDAVNKLRGGTSTDVLQTIAKLPEYKEMMPQIRRAIDVMSKILRRDISFSTIRDIIHLATSTQLQASFQWRPWVNLITKELPAIVRDWSKLFDTKELVVGHGSFRYEFPEGSLSRSNVVMTVRSKIVVDLSGNSLATGFLGIDGLGILPKPSNLWDLIPFSFVANWFTGVGAQIERVEYAALLYSLPAFFVHTYTFTAPLSEDELSDLGVQSDLLEPLSLKLYFRHVSIYSPVPSDTRFSFGAPTTLPPISVIGSLLFQLLS
jgi:hypothetical protein